MCLPTWHQASKWNKGQHNNNHQQCFSKRNTSGNERIRMLLDLGSQKHSYTLTMSTRNTDKNQINQTFHGLRVANTFEHDEMRTAEFNTWVSTMGAFSNRLLKLHTQKGCTLLYPWSPCQFCGAILKQKAVNSREEIWSLDR